MFLAKKKKNEFYTLPIKELTPKQLKALTSPLAGKIIKRLAQASNYPKKLAKDLQVHEQKIYYHIKKLQAAEIIKVVKQENKQGAIANYYALTEPAFAIRFKELKPAQKIVSPSNESTFLEPFVTNGELQALIVVGSPDPHGPEKARSRDGYYGMDFALFLGTFLSYIPKLNVRLDTEIQEKELQENLIIFGGPVVNNITNKINNKLPIRFDGKKIISKISGKTYYSDETGIIIKTDNPFNKNKKILLIAGKRYAGTRACIIAFLKNFKELTQGNQFNSKINAKVVEGIDLDSDGVVDEIEIKE